jgi:hypothetical protein
VIWPRYAVSAKEGRLLPSDAIVLGVITGGVTITSYQLLGLRDTALVVIVVMTWLSGAVLRLTEFRRGVRAPLKIGNDNVPGMLLVTTATGLWIVTNSLRSAYPTSGVWTPLQIPAALYALGILLTIRTLAEPVIRQAEGEEHSWIHRQTGWLLHRHPWLARQLSGSLIPAAAICLISGSPLLVLFSGLWLIVSSRPTMGFLGAHRLVEVSRCGVPPHAPPVTKPSATQHPRLLIHRLSNRP